jgi:hypothetical protein
MTGWLRWLVVLGVWPALVVPGYVLVERYASTPGRLADPPPRWPEPAGLVRTPGRASVVLLAHPRCPCTRATLAELARLMPAIVDRADVWVLFLDPAGADWTHTELWSEATAIPGVQVLADPGGRVADTLHAYTSGQVVVYDPAGALIFNGGITPGRGHQGSNEGRSDIAALIHGDPAAGSTTPVFGCDLHNPESSR